MSWSDYLNTVQEAKSSRKKRARKSGAGLEKSLTWLLDQGPQKKGGYPKTRHPNFRDRKFNDISAPPGAPGGLEEEVYIDITSFDLHQELEPHFWDGLKLRPRITRRLQRIVEDFMETLSTETEFEDVRLTGSLANYNWSKYSDVDLHIVIDFGKVNPDKELVKSYFDAARARWNDNHNIKIHGYEVEIYIENIGETHHSSGIYSIIDGEWIVEPPLKDVAIDMGLARKKSDDILTKINLIKHIIDQGSFKQAYLSIERIKAKIRRLRKAGLDSPQAEFSPENIAFKILRREEALAQLQNMKEEAYDKMMSIGEANGIS